MTEPDELLRLWCIYEKPSDFPNSFVVRQWIVNDGGATPEPGCILEPTLERARRHIPFGSVRFPHIEGEDPCIVETWV